MPAARKVFEAADAALGFAISKLCFEGPAEELQLTANTQPAILTVSVAAAAVLREKGVHPDFVAGHSLGEYSALVAAGALSLADAVRLVRKRGQYMQEAVPVGQGAMAAILGLDGGGAGGNLPRSRARGSGFPGELELARARSSSREAPPPWPGPWNWPKGAAPSAPSCSTSARPSTAP